MARPKINIDPKQVEKLAAIGCPVTEIAHILEVSTDTLHRRFAAELNKGKSSGKTNLRMKQMEAAMSGNITMLIWLGKQMLGQAEKIDQAKELADKTDLELLEELKGAQKALEEKLRAKQEQ